MNNLNSGNNNQGESLKKRQYQKIVSLGSNCEITGNIRLYFQVEEAYPFDWWIVPHHALLKILNDKFSGLFDEHNIVVAEDKNSVIDKKYNMLYHHDFNRDENDNIIVDSLVSQLPNLKEKYRHLQQRFITGLAGKKVLFIRNRSGNDPKYLEDDCDSLDPEQCKEFCESLMALLPDTQFDLLVTNISSFEAFQYKNIWVFSDSITDYQDSDNHMVSPKGWKELFERNAIELQQAEQE